MDRRIELGQECQMNTTPNNHQQEFISQLLDNQWVTYRASGLVIGRDWSFGTTVYKSIVYEDYTSMKELEDTILKDIESGNIDSGMGYETVYGCMMCITTISKIKLNNVVYTNESCEDMMYGDIPEQLISYLEDCYYDIEDFN